MAAQKKPVVGAIIQARLGSSRLPGKVLRPLAGKPLLAHVIERLRQCRKLDRIVLATSTAPADAALLDFAAEQGIDSFAGSEDDVLDRFLGAARRHHLDIVVRICSDSPLIDWRLIDAMIAEVAAGRAEYSICDETRRHACEGFEVVTVAALSRAASLSDDRTDHEHVTIYIRRHHGDFRVYYQPAPRELWGEYRTSVDVEADYQLMQAVYEALYRPGRPVDLRAAVRWLRKHPEVLALNQHVRQKPVDAATRQAVFLLHPQALLGAAGRRVRELTKRLAENYHCVIHLAAPAPANLTDFAAKGYRTTLLPAGSRKAAALALATAVSSQARLIVYDDRLIAASRLMGLAAAGHRCLPLSTRVDVLSRELVNCYI